MSQTKVSIKRHVAKSLSYRILGSLTTIIIALLFGIPFSWASLLGVTELLIKPIIYFFHERIWYKWIKFGLIPVKKESNKKVLSYIKKGID